MKAWLIAVAPSLATHSQCLKITKKPHVTIYISIRTQPPLKTLINYLSIALIHKVHDFDDLVSLNRLSSRFCILTAACSSNRCTSKKSNCDSSRKKEQAKARKQSS